MVEWCSLRGMDFSGVPTAACPACGSSWLMVPVTFDPETYEVAAWGTDGTCYGCGTRLTVCTPVDHPTAEVFERGDG